MIPAEPTDLQRFFPIVNMSGETIPPFAAIMLNGSDADGTLHAFKPTVSDSTDVIFNGPFEIADGGYGNGYAIDGPVRVALDSGDAVPSGGDIRGVAAGDWNLREGQSGFRMLVADDDGRFGTAVKVESALSQAAKMVRIVEPVEIHPTIPAYKGYVQRWNATTNELEDDFLVWLRMY